MLLTFWKETGAAVGEVFAQKPAIAEIIVAFDQFNPVTSRQAQLV